jgi:ArsR family transcriptional regulator
MIESEIDFQKWGNIFKAIGHPIRLQIVRGLLRKEECNVNTIVEKLGIPQSTVSQHLSVLKNAGILSCRKKGVEICYFVVDEKVKKILSDIG